MADKSLHSICRWTFNPNKGGFVHGEEEIAQLPQWAQVAFAARCARRVQPVFIAAWPNAPKEHIDAVENAITAAERDAANAPPYNSDFDASAAAKAAARAAAEAICNTAAHTARAAADAADSAAADATHDAAKAAATHAAHVTTNTKANDAANAAVKAAETYGREEVESRVILAIRRDFDRLLRLAKDEKWNDKTRVPPEVFGPLWPNGSPPGWPQQKQVKDSSEQGYQEFEPLRFFIDPGSASPEEISELYHEISKLYVMMGGSGIDFRTLEVREGVGVYE